MTESGSVITISGTLTETSASRYKENIETIDNALDKILSMRGVTYNKIGNNFKEIGVIAEEVLVVAPELIQFNENNEVDSVSYSRVVAILIEAIKQLKAEMDVLKNSLDK
jgi:hypothetical protein